MNGSSPTKLIVGITGASGTIFGVRLLQMLHGSGVETHLVMSKWAARTLSHETEYTVEQVQRMAAHSAPLLVGRSGSGDFQRFIPDARNGRGPVQHANARGHRHRFARQPD